MLNAFSMLELDAELHLHVRSPDASKASVSPGGTTQREFDQIPGPRESKDAYLQAQRKADSSPRARIGPAESFILLSQSQVESVPQPELHAEGQYRMFPLIVLRTSHESNRSDYLPSTALSAGSGDVSSTESVERLLYSLSSSTGIDHPLCSSCASVLQRILQDKLEDVQKERDAFISFEREYQAAKKAEKEAAADGVIESEAEICANLERKNKQLKEDTARLIQELKEEEEEERVLNAELLKVEQEEEELERQEIR